MSETLHSIYLLEMTPDEENELAKKVITSDGTLLGYVHPLFGEDWRMNEKNQRYQEYREERDTEFVKHISGGDPLVIFEEASAVPRLQAHLQNRLKAEGTIYIVRTEEKKPEPLNSSWDEVATRLVRAHIEHVTLGGMYLISQMPTDRLPLTQYLLHGQQISGGVAMGTLKEYAARLPQREKSRASQWIDTGLIPDGCVGGTATQLLARGIDVSFSLANFSIR